MLLLGSFSHVYHASVSLDDYFLAMSASKLLIYLIYMCLNLNHLPPVELFNLPLFVKV